MRTDKSFADDLFERLGAVRGRVALLLRSTEAKPNVVEICSKRNTHPVGDVGRKGVPLSGCTEDAYELPL